MTDVDGDVARVERDGAGVATALVAQDGQRTTLRFDEQGRALRVSDAEGRFVEAAWLSSGLMQEWKDANGNATAFTWDDTGNLLTHTNARGAKKTFTRGYDGVDFTSPEGRVTRYLREASSFATRLTTSKPDGTASTRAYQGGRHLFFEADGTLVETTMQGDVGSRFGRAVDVPGTTVIETPSGLGAMVVSRRTSSNAPDDFLTVTEEVDETRINGRLWRSRYDGDAGTYTVTSPLGRSASATLDSRQRPLTMSEPGVLPVTYAWDARGRLASVTQGARSVAYTWGSNGALETVRNALGEETRFVTDSTGRVRQVIRADSKQVTLTQDGVGNLLTLTPADGQAHGFTYSRANEVTAYTPPAVSGSQAETKTYDLDGLLTKSGHADASETVLTRDVYGRVEKVTTPWWTNAFTRTATGQVDSATRGAQRLDWNYDGFLLTEERASGVASARSMWSYDTDFRVAAHFINDAGVTYAYDDDSLLTQAGSASLARAPTTGLLESVTVGTVRTALTHNGYGELSSLTTTSGSTSLYSEGLTYDVVGRLTGVTEVVEGTAVQWAYGYDALGRLTSATKNGGSASTWTYDGNGNRLTESGVASTYDVQDRLLTKGTTTFTWDGLGGRRSKTEGPLVTQYVHDGLGALQSVTLPGGVVIAYDYDARQRRIGKRRNGVIEKRWVYDGQYRVVAELDASGAVSSRFIYGSQAHSPDYLLRGGVTYAYARNHLGSVKLVVNVSTGIVTQRLDYDAWGNVVEDTAPGFQPFGFAGGVYDVDAQLTHFGFRDYDSQTGVWTSKDPIRLSGGLNLYGYGAQTPQTQIDTTGTAPIRAAFRIAGAGIRLGKRLGRNAAIRHLLRGGDIATTTLAEARALARRVSKKLGGKGACEVDSGHRPKNGGTGRGAPHAHVLGPDGERVKGIGHVFAEAIDIFIDETVEIINDPDGDGLPNTANDAWEWINPLPIPLPIVDTVRAGSYI